MDSLRISWIVLLIVAIISLIDLVLRWRCYIDTHNIKTNICRYEDFRKEVKKTMEDGSYSEENRQKRILEIVKEYSELFDEDFSKLIK